MSEQLDPLEQLLRDLRGRGSKTKVITQYTDADVMQMMLTMASVGLIPGYIADVDEIRCPCPFHDNHGSPTLWVNFGRAEGLPPGAFKCFSCGAKGLWHKLEYKITGKTSVGSAQTFDEAELIQIIEPKKAKDMYSPPTFFLELEDGFVWEHPDGDFQRDLLLDLGAKLTLRTWYERSVRQQFTELRLWLPVYNGDELVGDVLAALERPAEDAEDFIKEGFKKYINSTALESKETLWPLPYVVRKFGTRYIVVVEGPADALRLIQHGIPAVAVLGTGTWSDSKADRLFYAFDNIVTCFDGDLAGRTLTDAVTESLQEKLGSGFIPLRLPDGFDPGKFSAEDCAWLVDTINKRMSNGTDQ